MADVYQVLDRSQRQIRLLTNIDLLEGQICCQLQNVSLDDDISHETISWCWGDQTEQATILLNGRSLVVRGNAEELLRWIYTTKYRRVWLDAVCINQLDLDERSHQVMLMQSVYSQAAQTLLILDLDAEDYMSEQGRMAITSIIDQARAETTDLQDCYATTYREYLKPTPGTIGIDNCSTIVDGSRKLGQRDTWMRLMTLAHMFKNTDPRDKVYEMLGLRHMHIRSKVIKPGYSKNVVVVDVFIEVTRGLIEEYESLHILLVANSLDPLPGASEGQFPSWVPQYDYFSIRSGLSYRNVSMNLAYGDSNGLKAKVHRSDQAILAISGLTVDTIVATSPQLAEIALISLTIFTEMMSGIWNLAIRASAVRSQHLRRGFMDVLSLGSWNSQEDRSESALHDQFGGFLGTLRPNGTDSDTEAFYAFQRSTRLWSVNRKFYITETGYIGMGPRETSIGDRLVILFGSRTPCVLRKTSGSTYSFQGDTYVKAIMEGEYVKNLQPRDILAAQTVRFDIA